MRISLIRSIEREKESKMDRFYEPISGTGMVGESESTRIARRKIGSYRQSKLGAMSILSSILIFMFSKPATSLMTFSNRKNRVSTLKLEGAPNPDDEIKRQLQRARELLEKAKTKLDAKQNVNETERESKAKLPFFASQDTSGKREKVIKQKNEDGSFTTDGEMMAKLSESEQWEVRPLLEVFENEIKEDEATAQLAERDVAASIYNLRKVLQTEDFVKIFDSKNHFIGEQ